MSWSDLVGRTIACECGRDHVVSTREIVRARGAVARAGVVAQALGFAGPLLLVADPDTWGAAGPATEAALRQVGYEVRRHELATHPVAGPARIAEVRGSIRDAGAVVAIGSGTINDIVKSAATDADVPYMVVGTALSMNGYTSAISALLDGGVKRTVSARPAAGVVIDLDVCAAAPLEMTLAGLGDMLSKPFSEADWRLAHHLDGGYHCERPGSILGEEFRRMLDDAPGIGRSEPEALASLADAIVLSGMSMAMAGVSSPASGGEHLLSHYWDMLRYARDEHPYGLHGTQVGVACCLVEPLHHAVQRLRGTRLDVDAHMTRWPATVDLARARVRARHTRLPAPVVENVVAQAEQKWRPPGEQRARLEHLRDHLDDMLAHIGGALLPEGAIASALAASGAPTTPADVAPELAGGLDEWAHARDMRSRFTILDLAAELGLVGNPAGGN